MSSHWHKMYHIKPKHHRLFLDQAERFAQESEALRMKVGAVLVKNGGVISHGWNGTPPGWDTNQCEDENEAGELITKPDVIHAEWNLFAKCMHEGVSTVGSALYLTHSPCLPCAKLIHLAGVSEVHFKHQYRLTEGVQHLEKCGVKVHQHKDHV